MKTPNCIRGLFLLTLAFSLQPSAFAADRITATVTITNAPTTNGMTFVVNADTRTWTNSVSAPTSQILTNSTAAGSLTNLYTHLLATPPANIVAYQLSATAIRLDARTGTPLAVSGVGSYFSVTYSTQTVSVAYDLVIPYTAFPSGQRQTMTDGLVDWLNLTGTKSLFENSTSVANLVGNTNAQTITGAKTFSSASGVWNGTITNTPGLTGTMGAVSNGIWWNGRLRAPTLTNGVNYGNAFDSPGSAASTLQLGNGAAASALQASALGYNATASGENSTAIGDSTEALSTSATALGQAAVVETDAPNATAVGKSATVATLHTNSTAIGASALTTAANQIRLGTSAGYVSIPGGLHVGGSITNPIVIGTNTVDGHIKFIRYAASSLANGNNAAVPIATNTFVEVSGPSAAFSLNGIANGSDGRFLIVVNQTGFDMTLAHQSGTDPTAANRIITMTGADRTTTGNGAATLIYSAAASRWLLISLDP